MEIRIQSLEDLSRAADLFLSHLGGVRIIAFYGKMGVGKTTFIKMLCKKLGVEENVTSPTFNLVNEYRCAGSGTRIFHFDFYRIKNLEEVFDMGYEDYFYSDAYCFIEWPELIEGLLPEEALKVHIEEISDKVRTSDGASMASSQQQKGDLHRCKAGESDALQTAVPQPNLLKADFCGERVLSF